MQPMLVPANDVKVQGIVGRVDAQVLKLRICRWFPGVGSGLSDCEMGHGGRDSVGL